MRTKNHVDCPSCDGTGNYYRHDEDGDFLECDDCEGTSYVTKEKRAELLAAERAGEGGAA